MAESKRAGDAAKEAGMESMGSGVADAANEIIGQEEDDEDESSKSNVDDAFKDSSSMATSILTEGIIK